MRAATLALALLAGCHAGVGPSAGVSLTRGGMLLGWEATSTALLGIAGGRIYRRDHGWRRTSWGALTAELPLSDVRRDGAPLPLGHVLIGGAEGDGTGYLVGVGAGGMLPLGGGGCGGRYAFEGVLSLRHAGGDTQIVAIARAALFAWPCK